MTAASAGSAVYDVAVALRDRLATLEVDPIDLERCRSVVTQHGAIEVRAHAQTDRRDPRFQTVEDLITWEFRFPSGAISTGSTSFNQAGTMAWEVYGERGKMIAEPGCFYNGNRLTVTGAEQPNIAEIDQFAREMDWMADVVRGRVPLVSPGEEGVQDMRQALALWRLNKLRFESGRGGAPVRTDWGYRRAVDPAVAVSA